MLDAITGNRFKSIADDFIDESKPYIDLGKSPQVIFLYTDWLDLFKLKVLPNIKYPFILITHNSDQPAPGSSTDLLEDQRLYRWFGMNCNIKHPKLIPIPIGIANQKWPHGNQEILNEVASMSIDKVDSIYCNFDLSTNSRRRLIMDQVSQWKNVDINHSKVGFRDYLILLKQHRWVVSPPGNSIDCHRIWEALYLETIPIVEQNVCHESWSHLSIEYIPSFEREPTLLKEYETNKMMFFSYFESIVKNTRQSLKLI